MAAQKQNCRVLRTLREQGAIDKWRDGHSQYRLRSVPGTRRITFHNHHRASSMNNLRDILLCVALIVGTGLASAALPASDGTGQVVPSLAPLIERVSPAVVTIVNIHAQATPSGRKPRSNAAGSGVIVDARQGLILSNHHVIDKADKIQVSLVDGRQFEATLVGSDPGADLALLLIKADNLQALNLADSDRVRVGDFVVAIGNPFGLGQTVTSGIVSALGRTGLGIENYENFIQTDASINPGNSGGALINLKGELVGINTAIIAPRGGNSGIGFAIPSNMAKTISQHLARDGQAQRGSLGVAVQDVTPDLARAFQLPADETGVLVNQVKAASAAEKAGIQTGDIIQSIGNAPIRNVAELKSRLGVLTLSDSLRIRIFRATQRLDIDVLLDQPRVVEVDASTFDPLFVGVMLDGDPAVEGVRVLSVRGDSAAALAGLSPGDRIVNANRHPVTSLDDLGATVQSGRNDVLLRVSRRGGPFYIVLNRPRAPITSGQ